MLKQLKDNLAKFISGSNYLPEEVLEAHEYFRHYGAINFKFEKIDNEIMATSTNYKWGLIITSGKNLSDLDRNIKDAILTAFCVPSSYARRLDIKKVNKDKKEYALA